MTGNSGRDATLPFAGAGSGLLAALDKLAALADNRLVLWATVLALTSLFWLTSRLPMADLPQHAGQVSLWRDVLLSTSPWSDRLWINLGTPYLVGYALALPLAMVLPVGVALSIVMSCAFVAFVGSFVALRKELGGDPRLDWLGLPSFFGLAWQWGFYPFVVLAPLVFVFVLICYRHVAAPTFATALGLSGVGLIMLFGHGLTFIFAFVVGGALVLVSSRSVRQFIRLGIPFALLASAFLLFFLASRAFGTPAQNDGLITGFFPLMRLSVMFAMSHGFGQELAVASAALFLIPIVLGLELDKRSAVPFAVLAAWIMLMPHGAMGTGYFFERFGMFSLPFYLVMWRRPTGISAPARIGQSASLVAMVLVTWASFALMAHRIQSFGREVADFETVLAAAEPGKRAMGIKTDYSSPAAAHSFMYLHFATWYQVDKRGLVDFNFAQIHNLVVRYKPEHLPAVGLNFEWQSHNVDWHRHRARDYDYYFVRHGQRAIPPQLVANGECSIDAVASSGAWTLLKRGACKN